MDRLHAMSVFVVVAEEAGFSAAARRLTLSAPSVTRAVHDLERHIGARLLHRTTRSVSLTDTGHRYLTDCRRILADIEEAERHAAGLHGSPRGQVSVTASVLFGRMMVAPALLTLLDAYPAISVSTLFVDRVVHVVNEGIDVAVRIAELPDSSLTAVRVGAVRRVLCAAPAYLDRKGTPETPADLASHDIVKFASAAPDADWLFHKDAAVLPVRAISRLQTNTADVAINAAVAGRGITRVLSYMVAEQVAAGTLQVVLAPYEPPPVPVHVVHKETGHISARVRAVVDHLVEALRQSRGLG